MVAWCERIYSSCTAWRNIRHCFPDGRAFWKPLVSHLLNANPQPPPPSVCPLHSPCISGSRLLLSPRWEDPNNGVAGASREDKARGEKGSLTCAVVVRGLCLGVSRTRAGQLVASVVGGRWKPDVRRFPSPGGLFQHTTCLFKDSSQITPDKLT